MENNGDLGFTYAIENAVIQIYRSGKIVTVLRKQRASAFLEKIKNLPFGETQQVMARVTGNYKRGNERKGKNHPRNIG